MLVTTVDSMKKYTMEISGYQLHILQNIFFCVQQKKETLTYLDWHEGE